MIPLDWAIWALAAIGAVVVAYVVGVVVWILAGIPFALLRRLFGWLATRAYFAGGGRTNDHSEGERLPGPPYDRIWVEFRYLGHLAGWAYHKTGATSWRKSFPERPDLDALQDARDDAEVDQA